MNQITQPTNLRVREMLDTCSDETAIAIAELICAHRLAGLETHALDSRLNIEISRMNAATRILCGRMPDGVKYSQYNELVKRNNLK